MTKKSYTKIFCTVGIIFIILILLLYFVINKKYNNKNINSKNTYYNNIENVKTTIVTIIPEQKLIKYLDNPKGIISNKEYGIGTGFFISSNGKILTSNHLISNKNINYYIITSNNKKYKANIIKQNIISDTAIIQINSKETYNFLKINKNYIYQKKDKIYSFGIDTNNKKTIYQTGTIINTNNKLNKKVDLIEFIPQISKGFSGGAILNSNFELIGINYGIKKGISYGINISNIDF